jgi:prepilin-type N-terminal cleavage/methylation domain-containing protein
MHSTRSAFTLIELLVVISIIAVLASLSFPAITGVMVNARKAQARNDMSQIASAIKLYYTEYGKYPAGAATSGSTDTVFGTTASANSNIIDILRYNGPTGWTDANSENPRQIKFIEPKVTDMKKACVNKTDGNWYDPWGTQYLIFIDADYANDIDVTAAFSDASMNSTNKPQVSVGVASVGYYYVKNKYKTQQLVMPGARAYNSSTDLLSWQ